MGELNPLQESRQTHAYGASAGIMVATGVPEVATGDPPVRVYRRDIGSSMMEYSQRGRSVVAERRSRWLS